MMYNMLMATIPLTKGAVTTVDDQDLAELSKYSWHLQSMGYAARRATVGTNKTVILLMHRQIMDAPKGMVIDHINGNPLDNRRENLRLCLQGENLRNKRINRASRSGYVGVNWHPSSRKWLAVVMHKRKNYQAGLFTDRIEAAHARDAKALELHGEFAALNFPKEGIQP